MKITYESVLNSMRKAYFESSGNSADELSDIGARLKAVASEIFSLYCYSDFVLKQAFPQTATGEYLDKLGYIRGVVRKADTASFGSLTFYLNEPQQKAITIPEHTICSVKDSPYMQFSTVRSCTIAAGELSATVNASSLGYNELYNVDANTINVIVNPVSGVAGVTNEYAFTGGCRRESDEQMRKRLCNAYKTMPNSVSLQALENDICSIDDVIDCNAVIVENCVNAYVRTRSGTISDSAYTAIENKLGFADMIGLEVNILIAESKEFDLQIFGVFSDDEQEVRAEINRKITAFCADLSVGEELELIKIIKLLANIDGFEFGSVQSTGSIELVQRCNPGEYLTLGGVSINE